MLYPPACHIAEDARSRHPPNNPASWFPLWVCQCPLDTLRTGVLSSYQRAPRAGSERSSGARSLVTLLYGDTTDLKDAPDLGRSRRQDCYSTLSNVAWSQCRNIVMLFSQPASCAPRPQLAHSCHCRDCRILRYEKACFSYKRPATSATNLACPCISCHSWHGPSLRGNVQSQIRKRARIAHGLH